MERKLIRNALRVKAERLGVKPSEYIARRFDRIQIERYGKDRRRINQAKGTHKRRTWGLRVASVV